MPPSPTVRYFLFSKAYPVIPDGEFWGTPLPTGPGDRGDREEHRLTVGRYLEAIHRFLAQDDYRSLCAAVAQRTGRPCAREDLSAIFIFQEKHGEFYHPARVEAVGPPGPTSFVVNGAVSVAGRRLLEKECSHLQRLKSLFGARHIPEVYQSSVQHDSEGRFPLAFFLGEWFEGFHEFHRTHRNEADAGTGIRVWHPDRPEFFLNPAQEYDLYRNAAAILAMYYNLETLEEIYPWHHAAGDFIVRIRNGDVDVRLVTVRQYAPMIEPDTVSDFADIRMDAHLLFLVNMTMRMRLDRIEGTGETVWAGPHAVAAAVSGFFNGLSRQSDGGRVSPADVGKIRSHLRACSGADVLDVAEMLLAAQPPTAPDTPLIERNLRAHVRDVVTAIQSAS